MKRKTIDLNGLKLFYLDTEVGQPTILCLHGRWGRAETWSEFIGKYRDRYRIIAPDQRGHGLSDKPVARYGAEDLAEDAYRLIEQLDCGPVIAVGHSMGGRVAGHLAALQPESVRALAILDETAEGAEQAPEIAPEEVGTDDGLTADWPTPYACLDDALTDLAERFPRDTNQKYFLQSLHETEAGYDFLFSRRAMTALAVYNRNWFHILPEIKCPVLLVRAAESWCLSQEAADKMRPLIKDVTYFEVPDSDHMVYADNNDAFCPPFDQWLRRVTG